MDITLVFRNVLTVIKDISIKKAYLYIYIYSSKYPKIVLTFYIYLLIVNIVNNPIFN